MIITRISELSGAVRSRDLPVTEEQLAIFESGESHIQDIFPQLSAADREFIKTGVIDEEWDSIFAPQ